MGRNYSTGLISISQSKKGREPESLNPQVNVFLFNGVRQLFSPGLLACHFLDAIIMIIAL